MEVLPKVACRRADAQARSRATASGGSGDRRELGEGEAAPAGLGRSPRSDLGC